MIEMSVRSKHNRDKNTFVRIQMKKRIMKNLQNGLSYGKGGGFFHMTKAQIQDAHHGSRYK
jgi:hypothetical protein